MIFIFRLGHRIPRDERISTHVALVARAFGADGIIYTGQHDSSFESSVLRLINGWGGVFSIKYEKNFLNVIKNFKKDTFTVVHLTMYGIPLLEKISEMKNAKNLLVVVGGEHVSREVYELSNYNIAITNQPHSEVAALAIFLDRIMDGKELTREFDKKFNGKIKITPSEHGKKLIEK